jgi:acetyl esterase/lipase
VEQVRGVVYSKGPEVTDFRHRLDLFLPKGRRDYPVVVLVHGGAWMMGDNRCCGLYSSVGELLASQGVGAVLPNYRLSPGARHPEHVADVARAFAWAHEHIADYGGRPDRMFLAGHSAGGHLVALLATDETFLKVEGLSARDVRGVIGVSGVYRIPPGPFTAALGGAGPGAFSLDELTPLRGAGGWGLWRRLGWRGPALSLNVFGPAFGDDPRGREDASPVNHVRPGLPPFLLFTAENDLPALPGMARELRDALLAQGCEAELVEVKERNHNSILFRAVEPQDPVAHAILEFVRRHADDAVTR